MSEMHIDEAFCGGNWRRGYLASAEWGGMGMSGQGHQGMMGGQGQQPMPIGSMPQCPPGQTASGNPPTCR